MMTTTNSKIQETKTTSRAVANAIVQPKLNVSTPGDRHEVEADRAAAHVVNRISDNTQSVTTQQTASGDLEITRLQRQEEEEEAQTKIQKQCCEEEEEAQMKIQRHAEEEEEELQPKIQRQAEEEEEELQPLLQRQAEEEEEEPIQAKNENNAPGNSQYTNGMVEQRINQRRGGGSPLAQNVQREMESGFGNNFSNVRIHNDAEASKMSSAMNAQAFTTGSDIYFNEGKYKPDDKPGKSLLAHELTHVIQQNGKTGEIASKTSAGVTAGNSLVEDSSGMDEKITSIPKQENTEVQMTGEDETTETPSTDPVSEPTDSASPEPANEEETPAPAVPSLNLTPGNTLTRGDNFKATFMFQPTGAETYRITAWTYTTDEHGTVTRPAADADFQNKWDGIMAMSGTLEVTYRITPDGAEEGAEATLSEEITVNDRTGTDWEATTQQNPEGAMAGSPSPPVVFSDLGHHDANVQMPALTLSTIDGGPNRRLRFVESLTAGVYSSTPTIHPDLNDATSTFHTFHQHPGRLYFVVGGVKTLIPPGDYSNLSVQGNSLSWDVPDWETFFKTHNILVVTATAANGNTFVVPDTDWTLDNNARDSDVTLTNESAVRTGLGIDASEGFSYGPAERGSWAGHEMMQAGAILTGTRSHEYVDTTHSHRANFLKMMSALEPEKMIEKKVSAPGHTLNHNNVLTDWRTEILKPNHEIVDEQASADAEEFVAETGNTMAGVNTDPGSGSFLGSIWNITGDSEMTN